MAGHSKWHNIKHKKMAEDQRRGKLFSKLIREIQVAVRLGGPNPDSNPRLRLAIENAREANMPKENIEKAIKKATGVGEGERMEEVFFEGYGPGGVALYIQAITDNRNRTSGQIRAILSRFGGSLAEAGSVSWMFNMKGVIYCEKNPDVIDIAIEEGAEDIREDEEGVEIITMVDDFEKIKRVLQENGFKYHRAEITYIPTHFCRVEGKNAELLLRLLDTLDENEDVQRIWSNFDIPDEDLKRMSA